MPHLTMHPTQDRFDVTTEWADKELIKTVPGVRWDGTRKTWTAPMSWAACLQLRTTFGARLTMSQDIWEWAVEEKKRVTAALAVRNDLTAPDIGIDGLFPHQRADVMFAEAGDGSWVTGNDMGTGKTVSVAAWLRHLAEVRGLAEVLPAIAVVPNSTKGGWRDAIATWFPQATPYVIDSGNKAKVLKAALADPTAFVIVNYEAARTLSRLAPYGSVRLKRCPECGGGDLTVKTTACETHHKPLNELGARTVIADEAHKLKDPKSKQTRAVWALAHGPTVLQRVGMTGTPIVNHIGDAWSIMHMAAEHEYPVRSSFIDRYALLNWNSWGGMDIVGLRPDTKEELFGFFDARFRRMIKADVLTNLPPKLRSVRLAPMSTKMAKAYNDLEEQLVTRLDDGTILFSPGSLTTSLRLLQLSSSYGTMTDDGKYVLTDEGANRSPKLDVMMDLLDELGDRQAAVCALSRQLIDLAAKRLDDAGITYGIITGSIERADRDRYLQEFQAGKRRVMLFTVQAGGVGLTMTAADTIIFLQRSWSIVDNKQAEDRVHRIGSEIHESIQIIDIIAPDTIEVKQVARLTEKLKVLDEVTRDGIFEKTDDDDLRGNPL